MLCGECGIIPDCVEKDVGDRIEWTIAVTSLQEGPVEAGAQKSRREAGNCLKVYLFIESSCSIPTGEDTITPSPQNLFAALRTGSPGSGPKRMPSEHILERFTTGACRRV